MTAQEAKELLKDTLMVRSDAYYDYIKNGGEADVEEEAYFDALNTAIKALEKQIPKKPDDGNFCPSCGNFGITSCYQFCPDCGQALNWRVEE